MHYKLLGNSGLRVSELCLGTMTFGDAADWTASANESRRIFEAFVARGGNFIDTADFYTAGQSETLVGQFVGAQRANFVIATKYTSCMRRGDPNAGGNHRKNFRQALEASLRRLATDYIDVYLLHAWDGTTPVDEVMRAFDDAVRAGKVLYAGISNTPAWVIAQANTLAALRGWTPLVSLQVEYSLIQRTPEREMLPVAKALGLGVTAWSPLASGLLSGKYTTGGPASGSKDNRLNKAAWVPLNERNLAIALEVQTVAAKMGCSAAQAALAWVRRRGAIPILGARKLAQVQDNLACLDVTLTDTDAAHLEEASRIEMGYPHEFLASPMILDVIHGGAQSLLEFRVT